MTRLPYHEHNEQIVRFAENERNIDRKLRTVKETQFTKWMEQNKWEMEQFDLLEELLQNPEHHGVKIGEIQKFKPNHEPWGFEIPYTEYPKYYSFDRTKRKWTRRGRKVICCFCCNISNNTFFKFYNINYL